MFKTDPVRTHHGSRNVVWAASLYGTHRGRHRHIIPDTGSTPYTPTVLPSIDSTDEVCEAYDAWIAMQVGNGEPGEGSPEWEDFIRHLAEIYPDAVMEESESEEA